MRRAPPVKGIPAASATCFAMARAVHAGTFDGLIGFGAGLWETGTCAPILNGAAATKKAPRGALFVPALSGGDDLLELIEDRRIPIAATLHA